MYFGYNVMTGVCREVFFNKTFVYKSVLVHIHIVLAVPNALNVEHCLLF